ncbi:MAG: sensor histidine kinase [Candidatus Sericytochromatia bacterium]
MAELTDAAVVQVVKPGGATPKVIATSGGEAEKPAYAGELSMPLVIEDQPKLAVHAQREAAFTAQEEDAMREVMAAVPSLWGRLSEEEAQLRQRDFMIAQVREQLETSEKLKAEFVATMSHELRTPLNVVLGFGSLLADEAFGPLNPEQAEACQKVLESTERLAVLINDLLDFSKLQARMLDFNIQPVVLRDLLSAVVEDIRPLADRKDLRVSLEVPADLPRLPCDADRLEQSIKHLVDNAIKFTPEGGTIGLRARYAPATGTIEIEVWDTGIGIPAEAMTRLFERFYQVDSSSTRLFGGTGIGLALVKELTERQGGHVTVESKVGEGSTFRLILPADGEEELVG